MTSGLPGNGQGADKERVLDLTRRHVAPHRVEVWERFGTQLVIGRRQPRTVAMAP